MYSVLLCDDELAVTASLKNSLAWDSFGIETVYCAADGLQALEIFRQHHIDLMITDIKMPHMDGLQLLREVRALYPETHVILLSAYSEFDYVRTAFRLGIDNYLLKPIQLNELTGTIESAVENLYLSRKNPEDLFRDNVLRRWLTNAITQEELAERSSVLSEINLYQSAYCAVCIGLPERTKERERRFHFLLDHLHRSLSGFDYLRVWDNLGRFVLVISGRSLDRTAISAAVDQALRQSGMEDNTLAVVGPVVRHSGELSLSYQQAVAMLEQLTVPSGFLSGERRQSVCLAEELTGADSFRTVEFDEGELSPVIKKALEYIHADYAKGVSIKEFCNTHTITPSYLGFLFKKETGTFFNNYLTNWRLMKAIELLKNSHEKVNVIGKLVGFTSTSYFISSFKKCTGTSPQKYREQHQQ